MFSLCTYSVYILEGKETRKKINEKDVVEDTKQTEKRAENETTKGNDVPVVRAEDTSKSKSSNSKSSEEEKPKVREGPTPKSAETTPEPKVVKQHKEGGGKSSGTASKSRESVDEGISIFNT